MGRRKRFDVRCTRCQMRKEICICEAIDRCRQSMETRTRIFILMHQRERVRTTNTARLATLALDHCEIRVRGLKDGPSVSDGVLTPERHPLLLYPTEDAVEITPELVASITKPVTLIVPDGTWGQAAKVAKRETFLKDVTRVKVSAGRPSQYCLRRGSRENGLATFEAIALALGVLEGFDVQSRLEELFELMVTLTLQSRGVRVAD